MDILGIVCLCFCFFNFLFLIFLFFYFQNASIQGLDSRTENREKKPPKFLVPGKGFFTPQPRKRAPKYFSEEEQWQMEQDERLKRNKYSS